MSKPPSQPPPCALLTSIPPTVFKPLPSACLSHTRRLLSPTKLKEYSNLRCAVPEKCCSQLLLVWSFITSHFSPFSPAMILVPPAPYSAVRFKTSCFLTVTLTAHGFKSSPSHASSNHGTSQFHLISLIFLYNTLVLSDVV